MNAEDFHLLLASEGIEMEGIKASGKAKKKKKESVVLTMSD